MYKIRRVEFPSYGFKWCIFDSSGNHIGQKDTWAEAMFSVNFLVSAQRALTKMVRRSSW